MASLTSLGIGASLFSLAMFNDMRSNLNSVNENSKSRRRGNKVEALKHLHQFIEINSRSKELSEKSFFY